MEPILTRCGYRCDLCLAYRPNVGRDPSSQQKLSDGWFTYFGFRIPPEQIVCDGCLADGTDIRLLDVGCPVRPCVVERGLDTCGLWVREAPAAHRRVRGDQGARGRRDTRGRPPLLHPALREQVAARCTAWRDGPMMVSRVA